MIRIPYLFFFNFEIIERMNSSFALYGNVKQREGGKSEFKKPLKSQESVFKCFKIAVNCFLFLNLNDEF